MNILHKQLTRRSVLSAIVAIGVLAGIGVVTSFVYFNSAVVRAVGPDLNNDGAVNGVDLSILLNQWGTAGSADLNNDGAVNGADLSILLGAWGNI